MIEINWTSVLGAALIAAGGLWAAVAKVLPLLKSVPKVLPDLTPGPVVSVNTDAPAPAGVKAYLEMVAMAARTADDKTKWEYASKELTEAAVLRAEVDRLAGGKS